MSKGKENILKPKINVIEKKDRDAYLIVSSIVLKIDTLKFNTKAITFKIKKVTFEVTLIEVKMKAIKFILKAISPLLLLIMLRYNQLLFA